METGLKKALSFLGVLDDQDIDWMVRNGTRLTIPAQSRIITEGEPNSRLYFILAGEFSVSSSRAHGELARLTAGEILGEISFVDSRPPSANATAVSESVVGAVPIDALEKKLGKDPKFAARFFKAIAVTMADRLRFSSTLNAKPGDAGAHDDRDVAPHLLDALAMAGNRFAELQRRPWGQA
jgi:CRP-like cAMP-binding protein